MIIFLKPGEQVEVQFISEGSVQDPATMKTYKEAICVRHAEMNNVAMAGEVINGETEEHFHVSLTTSKVR